LILQLVQRDWQAPAPVLRTHHAGIVDAMFLPQSQQGLQRGHYPAGRAMVKDAQHLFFQGLRGDVSVGRGHSVDRGNPSPFIPGQRLHPGA